MASFAERDCVNSLFKMFSDIWCIRPLLPLFLFLLRNWFKPRNINLLRECTRGPRAFIVCSKSQETEEKSVSAIRNNTRQEPASTEGSMRGDERGKKVDARHTWVGRRIVPLLQHRVSRKNVNANRTTELSRKRRFSPKVCLNLCDSFRFLRRH